MFVSFTAMPLHNFNFHSHVLVDMADKPNFRMFRDSFDVRHRAWISNTIHYLETNIKNKRRRTYLADGPNIVSHERKNERRGYSDSLRETPRETPCERLLARDSSRETSRGGRRTLQPTIDGSGEGDG
jgi:hypothetical protein